MGLGPCQSCRQKAPEARSWGLQDKPRARAVRTCVRVPHVLCREQGTTSKALTGGSGKPWGQGEAPGIPHPPGTSAPQRPQWERGLGTAGSCRCHRGCCSLHVPSLPACDKQDLKPERDSSTVITLCMVVVLGGHTGGDIAACLALRLKDPDSPQGLW